MKAFLVTCLKVLLVLALAITIVHVWPVMLVPLIAGLLPVFGLGCLLLAGLMIAGAVGLGLLVGLTAVAIALLALFSPVWIPLAVILGILWLVKRLCGAGHRSPATV
ncbi:MAG: hypothetical protein PHE83_04720 [Opitutaceae bacterium]|nr:hypothetical protein [Opitutaceae bacterium]